MIIDLKKATLKIKDNSGQTITVICGDGNLTYTEKKPRKYVKNWGRLHTVADADEEGMDVKFEFIWDFIVASNSNPNSSPTTGAYEILETTGIFGQAGYYDWDGTRFLHRTHTNYYLQISGFVKYFQTAMSVPVQIANNAATTWPNPQIDLSPVVPNPDPFTAIWRPHSVTIEDALKHQGSAQSWISTSSDLCQPYCVDLVIEYDPECTGVLTETVTLPNFRYEQLTHDLRAGMINCSGKCNASEAIVERN